MKERLPVVAAFFTVILLTAAVTFAVATLSREDSAPPSVGVMGQVMSSEESELCLAPLLRKPGPAAHYMLEVLEETIAEGGTEPPAGTCGAERIAWLRAHA